MGLLATAQLSLAVDSRHLPLPPYNGRHKSLPLESSYMKILIILLLIIIGLYLLFRAFSGKGTGSAETKADGSCELPAGKGEHLADGSSACLLYTSDAADE